jgi:hypothetical protein
MIIEFLIQKINFSPVYVIIRITIHKYSLQAGVCMEVKNKIQFHVLKQIRKDIQTSSVLYFEWHIYIFITV